MKLRELRPVTVISGMASAAMLIRFATVDIRNHILISG